MVVHVYLQQREVKWILSMPITLWIDVQNHRDYVIKKKTFMILFLYVSVPFVTSVYILLSNIIYVTYKQQVNGREQARLMEGVHVIQVDGVYPFIIGFRCSRGKFFKVVEDTPQDCMEGNGCVGTVLYYLIQLIPPFEKHSKQ